MSIRFKDRDQDKPKNEEERCKEYRQIFSDWKDSWGDVLTEMDLDMECLSQLGPWSKAERKIREIPGQERPCLHEDILTQFLNPVINQAEMNPHSADVQPEGPDANSDSARFVEDRLRQIDYEQNGQHAYMTGLKTAVECSLGYFKIETEWADPTSWTKAIRIVAVMDPKTILYDPHCKKPDWSDAKGAFELSRMTHEEFRQKWSNAKIQDFTGAFSMDNAKDWLDTNTVQVAAFWKRTCKNRKLLKLDDGSGESMDMFDDEIPSNMKRQGKFLVIVSDGMEAAGYPKGRKIPIIDERTSEAWTVKKIITNGIEELDETDWEDEEIPIMVITGRVKYENGKRVIDSLTRKGRTGQMVYDYLISGMQEVIALTAKPKYEGAEGQFDTSTDLTKLMRSNVAYVEFKLKTVATGADILPLPVFRTYDPPIQAYEIAKQSILRSLQSALGMTSTELKDKSEQSGKALQKLEESMQVTTYHFYNSQKIAQLRGYNVMNRLLAKIEPDGGMVSTRDVKGNHKKQMAPEGIYGKGHKVVIGQGKFYQDQVQQQSDVADSLLALKDPTLTMAVLPDALRGKNLGAWSDDLAEIIEAMQPPQMQAAREKQKKKGQTPPLPPQVDQAIKALHQQNQALTQELQKTKQEQDAKTLEWQTRKAMNEDDNKTKLDVAAINASVKESIETLNQQAGAIQHLVDTLMSHQQLMMDQQHQVALQQGAQDHAVTLQQSSQDAAALAAQQAQEQQNAGEQPVGA